MGQGASSLPQEQQQLQQQQSRHGGVMQLHASGPLRNAADTKLEPFSLAETSNSDCSDCSDSGSVARLDGHSVDVEGEALPESATKVIESVASNSPIIMGAMGVMGVLGFAFMFRRGYNSAKSSAIAFEENVAASKSVTDNLPNDGRALATKALVHATTLVSLFGVTLVTGTAYILDVNSIPQFVAKVRPMVNDATARFKETVRSIGGDSLPRMKKTTTPEEEAEAMETLKAAIEHERSKLLGEGSTGTSTGTGEPICEASG